MNPPRLLAVLPLALLACSDPAPAPADATVADASDATPPDAAPLDDVAPDASFPPCPFDPPRLGDSAAARALAANPERCGQTAFRWLASPDLGRPTGTGARQAYAATLLRALASGAGLALPVPLTHDVVVEQVSYTTQDRGRLLDATTLVAYPSNLAQRTSFEVLLVLHGTSGFNDACAPSATNDARLLGAAFASAGYVVVAPDYVGLRAFGGPTGFPHPYLVGATTAIASLDAVRAGVRHLASLNGAACARQRFVTIGGSQGGHAALWVDRIGAYYAPELEHMGAVATVPPADLEAQSNRGLRMTVQATANVAAFFTVAAPWYGLGGRLGEVFRAPWAADLPARLATQCSPDVRDLTRESLFTQAFLDGATGAQGIRAVNPWGCLVTENGLTSTSVPRGEHAAPGYGLLWVLGEQDQLVDTPIERASFEALCRQGYRMQYLECAGAAHTRATTWAIPEILEFARDRFAGRPLDDATMCRVSAPVRCRATPAM